ncbi:hypothetical protein D9619_010885 [Psilocybe cf. subviscida]|uniref:Uncharacterized protein n=1 Tax=Psilocybe cf. subviscida TaxID=2480587 RepID=A0A8H5F084_9AGAR|nr:hypothetical protein D9619_010885 [Psilocybe cf. subviscida]
MSSSLTIGIPGDATTCGTTVITWFYAGVKGVEGPLSLIVTNIGVSQDNPLPTSTRHLTPIGASTPVVKARADPTGISPPAAPTQVVLGTSIDADESEFLWAPVAVQSGWYIIKASLPEQELNVDSSPFFVQDSTDTSCLSLTTPSTTPPPASSTNPMTTSEVATATEVTLTNPSGTVVPITGATSSGLSKGAIVGITLGAATLALGWLAAWWFFFRKGKKSRKSQGSGGVKHPSYRGALASMDSTSGLMGKPTRSPFASRHPSIGTIPLSPSFDGAGLEKGSMNSTDRSGFPDGLRMAHHTQVPLSQRGRRYSGSSAMTLDFPSLDYAQTSRRPSHAESAYGRQSMESTTYPPTSPQLSGQNAAFFVPPNMLSRSHSISTSATHQPSAINQGGGPHSTTSHSGLLYRASPPSSAAPSPSPYSMAEPSSPDSPSSPTDPTNVTKRARRHSVSNKKRKPVPVYDPSAEDLTAPPHPASSSPSPSPIPPSTTTPAHNPHYTTRNRSQPELTHKSSFGPGGLEGKQLHYLIPDMPPPSKD